MLLLAGALDAVGAAWLKPKVAAGVVVADAPNVKPADAVVAGAAGAEAVADKRPLSDEIDAAGAVVAGAETADNPVLQKSTQKILLHAPKIIEATTKTCSHTTEYKMITNSGSHMTFSFNKCFHIQ